MEIDRKYERTCRTLKMALCLTFLPTLLGGMGYMNQEVESDVKGEHFKDRLMFGLF